jgi:hypothetical protein
MENRMRYLVAVLLTLAALSVAQMKPPTGI